MASIHRKTAWSRIDDQTSGATKNARLNHQNGYLTAFIRFMQGTCVSPFDSPLHVPQRRKVVDVEQ